MSLPGFGGGGSRMSLSPVPVSNRRNSNNAHKLTLTILQKNPNVLQVPSVQINSPRRSFTHTPSQRSLIQTLDVMKYGVGYTIHVAAAVDSSIELEDLKFGCDEDEGIGSLCSLNYEDLTENAARFVLKAKGIESRPNRSVTMIKIHRDDDDLPPIQHRYSMRWEL